MTPSSTSSTFLVSLLSPRLPGDWSSSTASPICASGSGRPPTGLTVSWRIRQRRAQRGVALVEIARQTEVGADVLVIVLGRESEPGVHRVETRERLRPAAVERETCVEKGIVERNFAGGRAVGFAARGTGESLHAIGGDGAARRRAGERVDGEVEAERSLVTEVARGMRAQAQVLDAAITLTVVEERGVDVPFGFGIGRDGEPRCRRA